MKTAALIVTTGLPRVSGVAALMSEVGAISAGQRIISTFQCAGVSLVGLVVGSEDKKSERQFAQNGVVFLRCEDTKTDFFHGMKHGLSFLQGKFDRIFVVPGDTPLFLPTTLSAMLRSNADLTVPEHQYMKGYPVLLGQKAVSMLLSQTDLAGAESLIRNGVLSLESVQVEDSGILIRGDNMEHRKRLIQRHNRQLSRPVTEVTLCSSAPVYDQRLSMLLHLVEDTRSVRDACSLMQISYSAAWKMLNHVEDELGFPLVTRIRGGSSGSGSVLTEKGKLMMEAYDRYSEHLNEKASALFEEIFFSIPELN